ncbi:ATP-binding protein [Rubneribacter badeniensis]|uniref:ATP-binding protein n=1 Tax=Rubneribacter badeniensis TaxID=2070688 RepID=UPI0007A8B21C|nr:Sensor histidine kinase TmoS [Coriobacteriaceae bacterium CHKCI002]
MNNQIERADHSHETLDEHAEGYDYARVNAVARIALYDDLRSAPRVTEIQPAPTGEFIENLASKVYEQAKTSGGTIPYTVIREVSENFIHARFAEVTVSILDDGNTIRFADQGPGIPQKEKAQLPGFTSAIEPMKRYIRGVGSGLPIVKEYLEFSHGTISIEDNLGTGSVVTISLKEAPGATEFAPANELGRTESAPSETTVPLAAALAPSAQTGLPTVGSGLGGMPAAGTPQYQAGGVQPLPAGPSQYAPAYQAGFPPQQPYHQFQQQVQAQPYQQGYPYPAQQTSAYLGQPAAAYPQTQHAIAPLVPPLSNREREFLPIFLSEGALGVTDLVHLTGVPQSSTHVTLTKLEQAGLIEKTAGQKRILTELGYQVANSL